MKDLDMLLDILHHKRGHGKTSIFTRNVLEPLLGDFEIDEVGNYTVQIGEPNGMLFACHYDTVHHSHGTQTIYLDDNTNTLFVDKDSGCLGADDGTGVWILIQMIKAGVPGLYVFHAGEETGCIGAHHIVDHRKDLIKDIKLCISFDRAGVADMVTHQIGRRCASDECADVLIGQLDMGHKKASGVFTDSQVYSAVIPECFNISVGYQLQHSAAETQDLNYLQRLMDALLKVKWTELPIKRDPNAVEPEDFSGYGGYGFRDYGYTGGYKNGKKNGKKKWWKFGNTSTSRYDDDDDWVEKLYHERESKSSVAAIIDDVKEHNCITDISDDFVDDPLLLTEDDGVNVGTIELDRDPMDMTDKEFAEIIRSFDDKTIAEVVRNASDMEITDMFIERI